MPSEPPSARKEIRHASAVCVGAAGLLILGASGSGKSSLALALMAHGAALVADDRTCLERHGERVILSPPEAIAGRIEARGVGLLAAQWQSAVLAAVVDLDRAEPERLPPARQIDLLGLRFPLILGAGAASLAPGLLQLLKGGRVA